MNLAPSRRVYVPSRKTFGYIVKEGGILGLKSSFAVVDDNGKRLLFVGDTPEFVYTDTSENTCGQKCDVPEDDKSVNNCKKCVRRQ